MHTAAVVAATLALLLMLGADGLRADDDAELHPDDRALLKRIATALPPEGSVEVFEKALGAERDEVRDLGFGATQRRYQDGAQSVGVWVLAVTFGDRVAALRIRATDIPPGQGRDDALSLWGEGAAPSAHGVEYTYRNSAAIQEYRRAVLAELGEPGALKDAEEDREALALLTDPLADLTFGTACYEDGSPPRGRRAVDHLRLRGAVAALDHVLRGLNPEGRVYAAQALRLLAREGVELSDDIEEAVYRVVELPMPIECCFGCFVSTEAAATLLSKAHLVGDIACSLIERLHDGEQWSDVGRAIVYYDGTWVWRRSEGASGAEASWRRGRLPQDVRDALFESLRTGEGMIVQLGTPIYVLHLDDARTQPPKGVAMLHAHLLGMLQREPR